MPTRVLTISKPYVAATHRKKFDFIAANPEWEVGLICPTQWSNVKYEATKGNGEDYWIKQLPIVFNGKNHFHFYLGLEDAIKEFQPDILNVEEEHYSFVTFQAFRIAKKLGIKSVFFAWQNIHKRYPLPFRMIERYVFRNTELAVVANPSAADSITRKGYQGEFFQTPQVGIDLSVFKGETNPTSVRELRHSLGVLDDEFLVMSAGRIVEEKGFQTIISACDRLRDQKVKAIIIGSGPYSDELANLVDRLKLQDRVHLIPFVPSMEMPGYFQASDVMCLASLTRPHWKEQGPTRVISEAMATGTNVIVSDSGELPAVVEDNALVFPEGNTEELVKCITTYQNSMDLRQAMRAKAKHHVQAKFSAEAIAKNFVNMFELVHKSTPHPS